jgi:hypothetical protein
MVCRMMGVTGLKTLPLHPTSLLLLPSAEEKMMMERGLEMKGLLLAQEDGGPRYALAGIKVRSVGMSVSQLQEHLHRHQDLPIRL